MSSDVSLFESSFIAASSSVASFFDDFLEFSKENELLQFIDTFIELSKTVRSKAMKERFTSFEKENPDFYNWGDIACVLGDDFLNDVTFEWMEKYVLSFL